MKDIFRQLPNSEGQMNHEGEVREVSSVGQRFADYLGEVLSQPDNLALQDNLLVDRPWGDVLKGFTRDLEPRLGKVLGSNGEVIHPREMSPLFIPMLSRGAEFISGGVLSAKDLDEGERRGLEKNGTWPDMPGAHFWDPRERAPRIDAAKEKDRRAKTEGEIIQEVSTRILELDTDASKEHVGRVLTMSLPALISWSDIGRSFSSSDEIQAELVDSVERMLQAEKSGVFDVVTFGCEPYEYEFAPNTTTRHLRRSAFGTPNSIRLDAMTGSFRGARRILEPLTLSGIKPTYTFFTSYGSSWDLIQRQVMPDSANWYREKASPEQMLSELEQWKNVIEEVGNSELGGSGIHFKTAEMEQQVVLPALIELSSILENCGMSMPDRREEFYYNSEQWFSAHMNELDFFAISRQHPNARMLLDFVINEEEWSRKHPEAYATKEQRIAQAGLLGFFEYCQYQRINDIINNTNGISLGVEIDEELIMRIRSESSDEKQVPLLWGRQTQFTKDGEIGGVGHRQPWFNAKT
ncbi:hypothetical protein BH09PAT1_BH09PAT1_5850 [soil metagenome]